MKAVGVLKFQERGGPLQTKEVEICIGQSIVLKGKYLVCDDVVVANYDIDYGGWIAQQINFFGEVVIKESE